MTSLHARLLAAVAIVAVLAAAAVAFSARVSTRTEFQRFQQRMRESEGSDFQVLLPRLVSALNGACCTEESIGRANAMLADGQAWLVIAGNGAVAATGGFGSGAKIEATIANDVLHLRGTTTDGGRAVSGLTLDFRGTPSTRITFADGSAGTLHVVPLPRDGSQPAAQFLVSMDRRLWIAAALVAVLAIGLTWGMTRRIVHPLSALRDAARDLARGELSRRVVPAGGAEIEELGRAFNTMAAEVQHQLELRQNLVQDVAHELRQPLTALQCRIETAMDGLAKDPAGDLRRMHEEVAHLSQLVSDLDELARAEARELPLTIVNARVSDVCASAIRAAGLDRDARLRLEIGSDVTVRADEIRLRQILLNLLTNADRYTPAGQPITVRTRPDGAHTIIEVHNAGSAIGPDDLAKIFNRFYRADQSRQRATGGSGLGLAIVKHLTEAQGGRAWAVSDASGVTVGVALPAGT